jgi:hypothetical protein
MNRIGSSYDPDEMMTERRTLHSRNSNNNNYDYNDYDADDFQNFNGEPVDVDDAIANPSRLNTAGSRIKSGASTRTKPSRVSLSENGSLNIDYGVVAPMPPPFPYPPMTPLTHFGRNASAISEQDTLRLVPDVGSRNYWQMKSAAGGGGSPIRSATLSETTSTSGVVSGDSSSVSDLKKPGSVYSGMYRGLGPNEHQIIEGLRSRHGSPIVKTSTQNDDGEG